MRSLDERRVEVVHESEPKVAKRITHAGEDHRLETYVATSKDIPSFDSLNGTRYEYPAVTAANTQFVYPKSMRIQKLFVFSAAFNSMFKNYRRHVRYERVAGRPLEDTTLTR